MPRQTRSSARPSARPAARSAPAAPPAQSRGAHTQAAPPPAYAQQGQPPAHAPAAPSAGGGMFANIASTAAGVAVGSTMGHGLSNMLFGGRGGSEEVAAPVTPQEQSQFVQATNVGGKCDIQAKDFVSCLNATANDTQSCSYYLDMLKQCQAAAAPY